MPDFVPGLELSSTFYTQLVAPLLARDFPQLRYSAGLLGSGSEVPGFDSQRSTDHHWGPRLLLFLAPDDLASIWPLVSAALAEKLPARFRGYSTNFGPPEEGGSRLLADVESGPIAHRIEAYTIGGFLRMELGLDPRDGMCATDWLLTPSQRLLHVTAGEVFHDGLDELNAVRGLLRGYPHDVWLYLIACQWKRISQEEAFPGRCVEAGDELGSRIVTARLVRDLMRLAFLFERRYAPYSKWLGTAFATLASAASLGPLLDRALVATEWHERERALVDACALAGELHNRLGITPFVDPAPRRYWGRPYLVLRAERFTVATREAIVDEQLRALDTDVGSIDQFADNTDLLSYPERFRRLGGLYA